MNPAIMVVGFNRFKSIERLLAGVLAADFSDYDQVPLIVSVDGGGDESIARFAERLQWKRGPLTVIPRPQRLGLRDHILACGDLADEFGSLILLEDDLAVSPHFYSFAASALTYYGDD